MTKTITITQKELDAALRATKRTGPVLSACKQGGYIVLHLCGDKEAVRWKPPARKKKASKPKTFTEG